MSRKKAVQISSSDDSVEDWISKNRLVSDSDELTSDFDSDLQQLLQTASTKRKQPPARTKAAPRPRKKAQRSQASPSPQSSQSVSNADDPNRMSFSPLFSFF